MAQAIWNEHEHVAKEATNAATACLDREIEVFNKIQNDRAKILKQANDALDVMDLMTAQRFIGTIDYIDEFLDFLVELNGER